MTGPARGAGDRGAGLVGTVGGVLVVLSLLLVAAQLLVQLTVTSTVTDAAYTGARLAASGSLDHGDPAAVADARRRAEDRVREVLGTYGDGVELDWSGSTPEQVRLRVVAEPPSLALRALPSALGLDRIDREVVVRVESLR